LSQKEIVVIVDKDNQIIGSAPRAEMRAKSLAHRATYILVLNQKGELFVHKRTMTKDVCPGFYDVVAGGVVLAGESYEQSAVREIEEELGIRDIPLSTLFDFYYEDPKSSVWGRAFSCEYNGEMILQEEEIESGEFMPVEKIIKMATREPFTPDGMYVLKRYLSEKTK